MHPLKTNFSKILVIAVAAALLSGGLFLFLNRQRLFNGTPAENGNGSPSPTPILNILSQNEINNILGNTLKLDNFMVQDKSVAKSSGCEVETDYEGRIRDGKQYSRTESFYTNEVAGKACKAKGVQEAYIETVWSGSAAYNRQNQSSNFEWVSPNYTSLKSLSLNEYLKKFIIDAEKFVLLSQTDKGQMIIAVADIEHEKFSGKFAFEINKADRRITKISYEISPQKDISATGEMSLTYSPLPIEIPLPSWNAAFLLSSLTDFNNYSKVFYTVSAENYSLNINRLYTNMYTVDGTKSKDCYLSLADCRNKLALLKAHLTKLNILLNDAVPVFCTPKDIETGLPSQVYKNRLVVKIADIGRNPDLPYDYSVEADFFIKGEKKNDFYVRLFSGKEYCYQGIAADSGLSDFSQKLYDLVSSF